MILQAARPIDLQGEDGKSLGDQGLDSEGPWMETTLKLVFSIVSRMVFSPVRLSAEIATSPLLTLTVARTTPGICISLFWSLRPQPVHSQPLIWTAHWSSLRSPGAAETMDGIRLAAIPPITNWRRFMIHLVASDG